MARKKSNNIFKTIKEGVNTIIRVLIVFLIIAFLMTLGVVAEFVGENVIPVFNGGKKVAKEVVQSVATDLLLIGIGTLLVVLSSSVVVPALAIGMALVGIGLIFYWGTSLVDTITGKKKGSNLNSGM